jgi:hypothetical protein
MMAIVVDHTLNMMEKMSNYAVKIMILLNKVNVDYVKHVE